MTEGTIVLLGILIFAAAILYSSVGHAGASGYLAAMALVGVAPEMMKPTALCLNILVATISTVQFSRAGFFSWGLFWPFAIASVPAAYLGGTLELPGVYYRPLVGMVLVFAAIRLLTSKKIVLEQETQRPLVPICLIVGAGIGLLAGLTGTGGGIFLTPLVLFMGWAKPKQAAGVSAAFILVNSIAGFAGVLTVPQQIPAALPWWAVAATAGALIGSYFGSRRLQSLTLRRLLGLVLLVAAFKMFIDYAPSLKVVLEPESNAAHVGISLTNGDTK